MLDGQAEPSDDPPARTCAARYHTITNQAREYGMSETFEHTPHGLWFSIDDRRYRLLSSSWRNTRGEIVRVIALYHGSGTSRRHQDQVNTSIAIGRRTFAR
jgi:hypothetical protein